MMKEHRLFCTGLILLTAFSWVTESAAETLDVTITSQDCRFLQSYEAEAGQDPAYTPGVDVEGNPVAPADLDGGTAFQLPRRFSFPLEVTPFPDSVFSTSAIRLGEVRIDADGEAYWNGESLTERDRHLVARECLKHSK